MTLVNSEHQNNINVNVCGYEGKKIFLLGITTITIARDHVNLLYITAGETSHYVLVQDLSSWWCCCIISIVLGSAIS